MKIFTKLPVISYVLVAFLLLQVNSSFAQKKVDDLIDQSDEKVKSKDFKGALKLLDKAVGLSAQNASLYVKRALVYRNLKKNKEALKDCKKALELDGKSTDAYYQQGMVYAAKKDFQEAVQSFQQALAIDKNYANAYLGMAVVKQEAGDAEGACEDAKKAKDMGSYEAEEFVKKHCRR